MTAPILVPLDGTEQALFALPVAKRLAELAHATLHLVHVAAQASPPAEVLARIGLSGVELRGSVLDTKAGEPGEAIVQAARELGAGLIVMCTHTTATPEPCVGHTALAVLKDAPCPVVLVRPERGLAPFPLHRILFPHDGTPLATAAIASAAEIALASAAELDVLHVATERGTLPTERGSLAAPRYVDQPQHEWPAWVQEFIERLACSCPIESLRLRMSLAHGSPGEEVLHFAHEHGSDLVVLAWHGDWAGERATTLKTVLGRAPFAVMVTRLKA